MNERYLFRGKSDNINPKKRVWVIGARMNASTIYVEHESANRYVKVSPATVGQCTGIRDKSGALIFEGDVIRLFVNNVLDSICEVSYSTYDASFCAQKDNWGEEWSLSDSERDIEVIGNIYDNVELLEAGA